MSSNKRADSEKDIAKAEQNKRLIAKAIKIVLGIVIALVAFIIVVFALNADASDQSSKVSDPAMWNSVLPGSTWTYSNRTADPAMLKADLKYCVSISFGARSTLNQNGNIVYDVSIRSSKDSKAVVTFQGWFTMDCGDGGTLLSMERTYSVHFSDMRNQKFDDNTALMRISVPSGGYLDLYLQNI